MKNLLLMAIIAVFAVQAQAFEPIFAKTSKAVMSLKQSDAVCVSINGKYRAITQMAVKAVEATGTHCKHNKAIMFLYKATGKRFIYLTKRKMNIVEYNKIAIKYLNFVTGRK